METNTNSFQELYKQYKYVLAILTFTIVISIGILVYLGISSPDRDNDGYPLTFSEIYLPKLELGHYALWGEVDGNFELLKRFNTDLNYLISLDGNMFTTLNIDITPTEIKSYKLTIEGEGDRNNIPNEFVLGIFTKDENDTYHFRHDEFNGKTPPKVSGFLSTPTDGNENINEKAGIWLVSEKELLTSNAFNINAHILYEGILLNIGKISSFSIQDDFERYSDLVDPGLIQPGEDFLRNLPADLIAPLNLSNGNTEIIISLEPITPNQDLTGSQLYWIVYRSNIPTDISPGENFEVKSTYQPLTLSFETDLRN